MCLPAPAQEQIALSKFLKLALAYTAAEQYIFDF